MKVQFANGKVYEGENIDEAIAKCLADGNDPFNPAILQEEAKQKKIEKNADTIEQ
jgi:hypothetical protein